jgi:hypothetical protein
MISVLIFLDHSEHIRNRRSKTCEQWARSVSRVCAPFDFHAPLIRARKVLVNERVNLASRTFLHPHPILAPVPTVNTLAGPYALSGSDQFLVWHLGAGAPVSPRVLAASSPCPDSILESFTSPTRVAPRAPYPAGPAASSDPARSPCPPASNP